MAIFKKLSPDTAVLLLLSKVTQKHFRQPFRPSKVPLRPAGGYPSADGESPLRFDPAFNTAPFCLFATYRSATRSCLLPIEEITSGSSPILRANPNTPVWLFPVLPRLGLSCTLRTGRGAAWLPAFTPSPARSRPHTRPRRPDGSGKYVSVL